jgi:hypothetical protein
MRPFPESAASHVSIFSRRHRSLLRRHLSFLACCHAARIRSRLVSEPARIQNKSSIVPPLHRNRAGHLGPPHPDVSLLEPWLHARCLGALRILLGCLYPVAGLQETAPHRPLPPTRGVFPRRRLDRAGGTHRPGPAPWRRRLHQLGIHRPFVPNVSDSSTPKHKRPAHQQSLLLPRPSGPVSIPLFLVHAGRIRAGHRRWLHRRARCSLRQHCLVRPGHRCCSCALPARS